MLNSIQKTLSFLSTTIVCLSLQVSTQAQVPVTTFQIPRISVLKYTLPNGLTVLLSPDSSSPVVAVDVWYHVGSKNEKPGRTGLAHLFEHMMFQGSEHIPYGVHTKIIEDAGGDMNGSTTEDHTRYFETLPSNQLETALWLESDRMCCLLAVLDQKKLDAQRDVVKNERRKYIDNQPFGSAKEVLLRGLYPADNSYSWPVLGSMADLSAATLDDVKNFFRTYYVPNNATLAVSGDFDVVKTKALIQKYFGSIPSGPAVVRPTFAPVKLLKEKRLVLEDTKAQQSSLVISWPTVGEDSKDDIALFVLSNVLTQDRTSRLTKLLVYDRQLATEVYSGASSNENSGKFSINIIPRPGTALTEIEHLIDSTLSVLLTTKPPSAVEVDHSKNYVRVNIVIGMDGAMNRAERLLNGQVYHNDPLYYVKSTNSLLSIKPEDITRVARKYLTGGRVVLNMIPAGKLNMISKPDAPYVNVTPKPEVQQTVAKAPVVSSDTAVTHPEPAPKVPAAKPLKFPKAQTLILKNGIPVILMEDHTHPVVSVNAVVRISPMLDPKGKTGLSDFTASLMSEGTTQHDADALTNEFAALGNRVLPTGFYTITDNMDRSLELMAEQFLRPAFAQGPLDRKKANTLAKLQRAMQDPEYIAGRIFSSKLYGSEHPYSREMTPEAVKAITRDDIINFYNIYYRPPNIKFVVAGDITPAQAVAKLNKFFGDLVSGKTGEVPVPAVRPVDSTVIYIYDRPGSSQSIVYVGQVGPRRDIPDFYAIKLMNIVLGGAFNSRINLNLREWHQYAYGARSEFRFRHSPEPSTFTASAAAMTAKTDSALIELMKEIRNIRGTAPVTDSELSFSKGLVTKGLPLQFETIGQRAGAVAGLVANDQPLDYYDTVIQKYNSVKLETVRNVASRYITPGKMVIVVIGDREIIEPVLQASGIAPVSVVSGLGCPE